MPTELGFTQYGGHNFLTISEARWAVFFDTHNTPWEYDWEAQWGLGNAHHYRPQFRIRLHNSTLYLEVQPSGDHRIRELLQHDDQAVYLAVGDMPEEPQLRAIGWWDPQRKVGVRRLTACYEWEQWFPPDYSSVLYALEIARTRIFEPQIPGMRPSGTASDIPVKEQERELPPGE